MLSVPLLDYAMQCEEVGRLLLTMEPVFDPSKYEENAAKYGKN
jgi:hypothetical protein